jgi:hypothetical protein
MARRNYNKDTFVKITNEDIYKELLEIKDHIKETNGKVKFHTKMIFAISGVLTTAIIFFTNTLIK